MLLSVNGNVICKPMPETPKEAAPKSGSTILAADIAKMVKTAAVEVLMDVGPVQGYPTIYAGDTIYVRLADARGGGMSQGERCQVLIDGTPTPALIIPLAQIMYVDQKVRG